MTEKDRKSRDAVIRRKMAHYVAETLMILQELARREKCESTRTVTPKRKRKQVARRPPTADEWERYIWKAMIAWQRCILTNLDDPTRFLKMVVAALQGKVRGKTYDEATPCLKAEYPKIWESDPFRSGFERGRQYHQARMGLHA